MKNINKFFVLAMLNLSLEGADITKGKQCRTGQSWGWQHVATWVAEDEDTSQHFRSWHVAIAWTIGVWKGEGRSFIYSINANININFNIFNF